MTTKALVPAGHLTPVSASSLDAYIRQVYGIPILAADEERALAIRLQENGDIEAAQQLIMSNLRFVVKIARGYMGYGLPLNDLIQEDNIGLMKAVKRFSLRRVGLAAHPSVYGAARRASTTAGRTLSQHFSHQWA